MTPSDKFFSSWFYCFSPTLTIPTFFDFRPTLSSLGHNEFFLFMIPMILARESHSGKLTTSTSIRRSIDYPYCLFPGHNFLIVLRFSPVKYSRCLCCSFFFFVLRGGPLPPAKRVSKALAAPPPSVSFFYPTAIHLPAVPVYLIHIYKNC